MKKQDHQHQNYYSYRVFSWDSKNMRPIRCVKSFNLPVDASTELTAEVFIDAKTYAMARAFKSGKTFMVRLQGMGWVRKNDKGRVYRVTVIEKGVVNFWATPYEFVSTDLWNDAKRVNIQPEDELMHLVSGQAKPGYKGDDSLWVGRTSRGEYVWVTNETWSYHVEFYPEIGWDFDEETTGNPFWWALEHPECCLD